jgi:hypothetical protein
MEILIRLFIWIVNRTYRRNMPNSLYGSNPMDEKVLMDFEESRSLERLAERQNKVVENFQSAAAPVQGAVDYADMDWRVYSQVIETAERFTFYSGTGVALRIAKVIEKSTFTNPQELAAFRRTVRRYVADTRLMD